ncbi:MULTISPECIES: AraC family transcriptional regulator [unclassified Virgibacillus]|uniref:helix-turn-helix domain-containing protein n=1 Tax=unclassified Virgibacillus TaxID=2620237 RepID=UPI0024DE01EE|nr:AraC family transcriptional regulator [Virgibacillus sp. LDC-1]
MQKTSSIQKSVIQDFLKARKDNEESLFTHPNYRLERELLYWVEKADEAKAQELLQQINELDRATLAHIPLRSLKNSLICSCTLFARATIRAGVPPEHAFDLSDVFIRRVENTPDSEGVRKLEYEMVHYFIQAVEDYRKSAYHNEIVDRAVQYIHDHILQPLTLKEIAIETNVSANYLSAMFYKVVGVHLKTYINHKKIDESKYFLRHTDSSLLDIALLFGFCNQSHYTSLFKRFTGMTPRKFKEKML